MTDADKGSEFLQRRLRSQTFGGVSLLEAVAMPKGDGRDITLFFKAHTPPDQVEPGDGLALRDLRSIGDGPMLRCTSAETGGPVRLRLNGAEVDVAAGPAETGLFRGLNVGVAVRNGESAEVVLDWLRYHATRHGMQAALIVDQARPGSDKGFARKLEAKAGGIAGLQRVVVLSCDIPLGLQDTGPEAHPMNTPGAPGKDRMDAPAPDAWSAPLGELLIYEIARARFLAEARAVANIDVHDLLAPGETSIFDRAVASKTGCIQLSGQPCYPWRLRKKKPAGFADHICVQFDAKKARMRWCVAPQKAGPDAVWRLIRVVGTAPDPEDGARFFRFMALRHKTGKVSDIVPKTSLVENEVLLRLSEEYFGHKPVRIPAEKLGQPSPGRSRTAIITTMKNEGPFILEWLAYHRAIGVDDFLIYTNDCSDGTDSFLDLLQARGLVQHRDNPFRDTGLKPQHAALQAAEKEPLIRAADWLICMDVDEYINIHAGDGRLEDLFAAAGDANMIAITWRLFGNADIDAYRDVPITQAFTRCAPQLIRKPHQAWGFKTLFRNQGIFKKLGVHRPKGLKPQLWEQIRWVNGSGEALPKSMYRNGWRSTTSTFGYDLVTLNHYAVRSSESFLVKRDRGRVNHVDRDQGLAYWFRMNNNAEEDRSIHRMLPALRAEMGRLLADPEIAAAHAACVDAHRAKIAALRATETYAAFYRELSGQRLQRLSRLHAHFGANVFLAGPEVVPDEVAERDPEEKFFFTVDKGETAH